MAAPGFGTSPFVLPNSFDTPGNALQQGLAMQERRNERQFELDWRLQRQKENDDWKKLQLIQELTDIDKYQTGEAVADAIGHQKANEILSKYTALAGSLTPAELQYKITQDIGGTTNGMQAMKDELMQYDAAIKAKKAIYPSLDAGSLTRDVRADIITRRLSGNNFANPISVPPSEKNLDDLDYLSDYIDINKGLKEAVVNPKNIQKDVTVLRGSPKSYVGYQGDQPFYMKDDFQTKEGFYNQRPEPTMSLKTSVIPQGAFSGAADKAIDVLDKDAYEGLKAESSEVEVALRKLAKTKYRNYSSMSNADKEIAMRDVAKDFIAPFSENFKYRAKSATKPPHYSSTTNVFGSGSGGGADVKGNEFDRIDYDAGGVQIKGGVATETQTGQPYSRGIRIMAKLLPAQVQAIMKAGGVDISEEEYFNLKYENGKLQTITPESSGKVIDRTDMANFQKKYNSEPQKGSQPYFGERDGSKKDNTQPQGTKQKKYKGLDDKGNPIFE